MAKRKRKVREDFWIWTVVIVVVAFTLIASWWKENAVLGWVIVAIVVIGFGYSLYRFPSFRRKVFGTAKKAGENIVYEEEVSSREPVPNKIRQNVLSRAHNQCENPDCKQRVKPHIHHIDGNNSHNSFRNLVVLCPNCHSKAHSGDYPPSQLRVWVNYSWERYKNNNSRYSRR